MLFISTSAARKDKGPAKPNLREIHHSGGAWQRRQNKGFIYQLFVDKIDGQLAI
jgi:hypothetical protein